jgi:hypothetical protein
MGFAMIYAMSIVVLIYIDKSQLSFYEQLYK